MKSTTLTRSTVTTLLLLCLAGAVHAGGSYYRWIDENGTTVNSDRPPPVGIDYQVIDTTINLATPAGEQEKAASSAAETPAEKSAAQEPTLAQHPTSQKDPKACKDARNNLETLNSYARIRISDGEGSYRFLNEDEKAAQRIQAEAAIGQFCE